jgi:sigma-B regulation protein RsbU (phosphoserine phosphatase)
MAMLLLALCLLQPVTMTASELRWDLLNVGVGVLLLVIGLAAISLFFFRFKSRDRSLVYFGLFTILYALRLLGNRLIIESVFDVPRVFWDYMNWAISCTIVLPFGLFLHELVIDQMKIVFRLILGVQAICAIVEIVAAVFGATLPRLNAANNIVTLVTLVASLISVVVIHYTMRPPQSIHREVRVFIGGFLFWFLFILQANLSSLRLVNGLGPKFEFLGFLVFVCCLGYIVAHRTLSTEERLLALHQELEIARAIQSATLPRDVPKLSGLEIAARYMPMSAVAGDFYDFLVEDEKHVGIMIADVSGHGVPAALIASMLKVAFAGQSQFASDPVRVLTGLNRSLCGKFEEHYVTGAYVFFDLERKLLRYAGAGHPPIMLASRSANTVRRIEENGTILGLIPDAVYTATEIPLHPLDRCLLYTDGVFEAMSPSLEEYSKPRMEKFLAANAGLSTNAFANALLADVNRWSNDPQGRSQDDDITMVVLDFQPSIQAGA